MTSRSTREPIVETSELGHEDWRLSPGAQLRILNVPTTVRSGGHEPGVRRYYSMATWRQLVYLREVARLRAEQGETEIVLEFEADATVGREAYEARRRAVREQDRKRYGSRMRRATGAGAVVRRQGR